MANTSKLHKSGKKDYLTALKNNYEALKSRIMNNDVISESEKKQQLKKLDTSYQKSKKESKTSLF